MDRPVKMSIDKEEAPEVFVIDESVAKGKIGEVLTQFTEFLLKENDAFANFALKDGRVQVVFTSGKAIGAKAETKFLIKVNGDFQDIEDTSDSLSSIMFPWSKVNSGSYCQIVIALTSTFKGASPAAQQAALIHEYCVHAIQYRGFLTFLRETDNAFDEVPFYYYYHSLGEGYLNSVNQHKIHGGKIKPDTSKKIEWNDYSGYKEFNSYIKSFLRAVIKERYDEDYQSRFIVAAKEDIRLQQQDAGASTEVAPPKVAKTTTPTSINRVKTVAGTMEEIVQEIALIIWEAKDEAGAYKAKLRATWQKYARSENVAPMLAAYADYINMRLGNQFGIDGSDVMKVMDVITDFPTGGTEVYTFPLPEVRDMWEAYAEYSALGGLKNNAGSCGDYIGVLDAKLLDESDHARIKKYSQYRLYFALLLNPVSVDGKPEAAKWKAYLEK